MSTDAHPWSSAMEQFQLDTLPRLRVVGMSVGDKAREGDAEAQKCVSLYSTLRRSFDPLTHNLLREQLHKFDGKGV